MPDLRARVLPYYVPACETGRHVHHPGETCDEYEEWTAHARAWWQRAVAAIARTPMSDVPAALRGPNWKAEP